MTTFLEMTNKVLEKFNEVALTTTTFANAVGFHSVIKEAVNNSVREINRESFQWPFNEKTATQVLVAEQTFYNFPADAKVLDFDTFTVKFTRAGIVNFGVLRHTDYDRYIRFDHITDQRLIGEAGERTPCRVFKKAQTFGIAPLPSNTDTLEFTYWSFPIALVLDTDVISIPSNFDDVIILGAMRDGYDFRTDTQQSAKSEGAFKDGIKDMRTLLLNDLTEMSSTVIRRR